MRNWSILCMYHLERFCVFPDCLHAYSKISMVLQDRFMVHVEFILFCLEEGNTEDAHQAALWYGIQTGHIISVHVACLQVLF